MKKLRNTKGRITLIELVFLLIIVVEVLYFVASSYGWLDFHMSSGNDSLYANTAESVAKTNSLNGIQCPVNNCEKGGVNCTHLTSQGYVGYFDGETNTIVGLKPKGYNSNDNPSIDGKEYVGKTGTMVLRVTCNEGEITLDWVKGAEE